LHSLRPIKGKNGKCTQGESEMESILALFLFPGTGIIGFFYKYFMRGKLASVKKILGPKIKMKRSVGKCIKIKKNMFFFTTFKLSFTYPYKFPHKYAQGRNALFVSPTTRRRLQLAKWYI
jgi:hypothetical protein